MLTCQNGDDRKGLKNLLEQKENSNKPLKSLAKIEATFPNPYKDI